MTQFAWLRVLLLPVLLLCRMDMSEPANFCTGVSCQADPANKQAVASKFDCCWIMQAQYTSMCICSKPYACRTSIVSRLNHADEQALWHACTQVHSQNARGM